MFYSRCYNLVETDVCYSPEQLLGTSLASLLFSETHDINADKVHSTIPNIYKTTTVMFPRVFDG